MTFFHISCYVLFPLPPHTQTLYPVMLKRQWVESCLFPPNDQQFCRISTLSTFPNSVRLRSSLQTSIIMTGSTHSFKAGLMTNHEYVYHIISYTSSSQLPHYQGPFISEMNFLQTPGFWKDPQLNNTFVEHPLPPRCPLILDLKAPSYTLIIPHFNRPNLLNWFLVSYIPNCFVLYDQEQNYKKIL